MTDKLNEFQKLLYIHGYTQSTFADAVGVHRQSIGNWQRGVLPRPEKAKKAAFLLGTNIDYLYKLLEQAEQDNDND